VREAPLRLPPPRFCFLSLPSFPLPLVFLSPCKFEREQPFFKLMIVSSYATGPPPPTRLMPETFPFAPSGLFSLVPPPFYHGPDPLFAPAILSFFPPHLDCPLRHDWFPFFIVTSMPELFPSNFDYSFFFGGQHYTSLPQLSRRFPLFLFLFRDQGHSRSPSTTSPFFSPLSESKFGTYNLTFFQIERLTGFTLPPSTKN